VNFHRVIPSPLGTDELSQPIEEWDGFNNIDYIDFKEFSKVLDIEESILYK
jgi:hypothetical protein